MERFLGGGHLTPSEGRRAICVNEGVVGGGDMGWWWGKGVLPPGDGVLEGGLAADDLQAEGLVRDGRRPPRAPAAAGGRGGRAPPTAPPPLSREIWGDG